MVNKIVANSRQLQAGWNARPKISMLAFKSGNLTVMLQGDANLVKTLQQACAPERVGSEMSGKSVIALQAACVKVNREFVPSCLDARLQVFNHVRGKRDGENAILHAVVGEDVGEGRSDQSSEPEITQRPDGVFARRSAAEVFAHQQYACAFVLRCVQREGGIGLASGIKAPVKEQAILIAGPFGALQELLGDDLVSVHVFAVQQRNGPIMCGELLHG